MNKHNELLKQPSQSKLWQAAIYIRLSKEDGDKQESYSVTSQREILNEYLKQHTDIQLVDYYIDDGWSGTNFDRPGFQRMLQDIYDKKVNCVIVKDLSRFGRNYTNAGYYLDDVFTRLQVRFIALNNGVDSISNSMNAATKCITVGVQNVINESVAATTSVNVRGTLNVNRKQGKFIGSFPTYGYLKDPEDHHKLIIDEDAAPVIRQIYKWFLEGKSIIGITKSLNASGISNPSTYKKQKGWNYKHTSGKNNDGLWCYSTVRRILSNQMYIGNMVQGKNTTISYKIKQCRAVPKDEWIIVENTHEPIISKDDFDKAQQLLNRKTRTAPQKKEVDLFSGFVKCADCGRAMSKKTNNHSYGTYKYYRCVTSQKMDSGACSNHSIRIDKLEKAVLEDIRYLSCFAIDLDEKIEKELSGNINNSESGFLERTLENKKQDCKKLEAAMFELYPDWKNGDITREEYLSYKEKMTNELEVLQKDIENLEKAVKDGSDNVIKENEFINHFKKFKNIDELTRPILIDLVDSILVHENGNITINYKFKDAYLSALEYIEANRTGKLSEIA